MADLKPSHAAGGEGHIVQPLWRTVWQFLIWSKIELPRDSQFYSSLPYFAVYNVHPHFWPKLSGKNLLNSFIYLYLETKPFVISQGTILHMDIVIAF